MSDDNIKKEISELQNLLNSVVLPGNLHTDTIIQISKKLDKLIIEYYSNSKILFA